jgi:hypothetical protein
MCWRLLPKICASLKAVAPIHSFHAGLQHLHSKIRGWDGFNVTNIGHVSTESNGFIKNIVMLFYAFHCSPMQLM